MNYKKRNVIGVVSFIAIFLIMLNINSIFEALNYKILGKKFIGIRGEELFLGDFKETILTKNDIISFLDENLNSIKIKKSDNVELALYLRNINKDDKFIELFRIPIDNNFDNNLYANLDKITKYEDLFIKFVLYIEDNSYISKAYFIKFVDDLYKNESKILINLDKYTNKGTYSILDLPDYIKFDNGVKINISANHGDLVVSDLECEYIYDENKIKIKNLVPGKPYSHIRLNAMSSDGVDATFNIRNLLTTPENTMQKYVSNIYDIVLNRKPYEDEYAQVLSGLESEKLTFTEFCKTIMLTDEFNKINDTPKKIIDSIYYIFNGEKINVRISALILDDFNEILSNKETVEDGKMQVFDKLFSDEKNLDYIRNELKLKLQ